MVNVVTTPSPEDTTTFYEYLTASRFYVELHLNDSVDDVDGLFMECKGLKYYQDVIEFTESFPEGWGRQGSSVGLIHRSKIPGVERIDNINLRRGMGASETLWNWIDLAQDGGWPAACKDGSITLYRQDGTAGARFQFEGAWPVSYTLSDSMVSGTDLAFEDLELACEGFKRVSPIS
ncbi:MAG: phage tail protein [Cyanobacteria bacterium P01_D01_bin.156]